MSQRIGWLRRKKSGGNGEDERKVEELELKMNSGLTMEPSESVVSESPSAAVPSKPDLERLSREGDGVPEWREDSIPEWRSDNDVCWCGAVELVYGGNVQVESDETPVMTLHRRDSMCEDFRLGEGQP